MSLTTWAHKFDPKVGRAKQELATLPIASSGHGAAVPWQFQDKSWVKKHFDNKQINARINAAKISDIDLHDPDLFAIQRSVKAPQVAWYLEHPEGRPEGHMNPNSHTPDDVPIVLQYKGKKLIWDGHHRMVAQWLLGKDTVEGRLIDFDEVS